MSEPGEINQHQLMEADTCRLFVTSKLIEAARVRDAVRELAAKE